MSKTIELRLVLVIEDVDPQDERRAKDQVYDTLGEVARELVFDGLVTDYRWDEV